MAHHDTAPISQVLDPSKAQQVRDHLKEVLHSHEFASSKRAQEFLTLLVERTLAGEFDLLRERMIGAELFQRPVGYDTANDPVVRVKATEVRKKLTRYYLERTGKPGVRIDLPSGTYVPRFLFEPENMPRDHPLQAEGDSGQQSWAIGHREGEPPGDTSHFASEQKTKSRWFWFATVALAICVLASAAYMGFRAWRSNSLARTSIHSIAIMPFENVSGDPRQDYFADGMTEELIADLGRVSSLHVISKTSSMSYKGTKKALPEIARELSVDSVVEGTVLRDGNQVRITVDLIDARTDHPMWTHSYTRETSDVLTLQGELAEALADEVSVNVMPRQPSHPVHSLSVSAEAEDLYFQGMQRLDNFDFNGALSDFERAVESTPNFAQAHAALATCYGRLGESGVLAYSEAFSKQRAEATKAIELDPSMPEGHAELANAAMNLNWDWATAATEFNRALELNPNAAPIHERYAVYLERTGNMSEAITEARRGLELDPLSERSFTNTAFTYYFSRRYDEAVATTQNGPRHQSDPFLLGDVLVEKAMYKDAINEFMKEADSPHKLGHLGNAYARAGQVREARKILAELIGYVGKHEVGRYEIALVYAGLGDKDEAFAWLEQAYKTHSEGLTNLKIDPCLDPLRSDPRFNDLVHRVGLSIN
jgi:TolB-like protein/Tfp pilus assembly protein PilF